MLTNEQREKIQDLFDLDDVRTISRTISKHSLGGTSEQVFIHINTPDRDKFQSIINDIVCITKDNVPNGNGFDTREDDTIYIIPAEVEAEVEQKEKTG